MNRQKFAVLLLALNCVILAVLGGLLHRTYMTLLHRVDGLYTVIQPDQADVDISYCDAVAVFAPMQRTIGRDMAHQRATAFMGFGRRIFSYVDCESHTQDAYKFYARVDGGDLVLAVCQRSGQILHADNLREVRQSNLTLDDGLDMAKQALSRSGWDDMALSHFQLGDHTVSATFSPIWEDRGSIEIIIGLDNGRVMGFFTKTLEA